MTYLALQSFQKLEYKTKVENDQLGSFLKSPVHSFDQSEVCGGGWWWWMVLENLILFGLLWSCMIQWSA